MFSDAHFVMKAMQGERPNRCSLECVSARVAANDKVAEIINRSEIEMVRRSAKRRKILASASPMAVAASNQPLCSTLSSRWYNLNMCVPVRYMASSPLRRALR